MQFLPRVRLIVARHPWIYWLAIVVLAGAVGLGAVQAMAAIDAERRSWGQQTTVWVATDDIAPGEPIHAESRRVPRAVVPSSATTKPSANTIARQRIGRGEMITSVDVSVSGSAGLIPDGWVALAVPATVEHFAVGDRVSVYSGDQFVAGGTVIDTGETELMIAVAADAAPAVAMGVQADAITIGLTSGP
jgi:hypothetical protein